MSEIYGFDAGRCTHVAMVLGQVCFGGVSDAPGDLLATISQLRSALEFMESRYARVIGREFSKPPQETPTQPPAAPRQRGRPRVDGAARTKRKAAPQAKTLLDEPERTTSVQIGIPDDASQAAVV
jgi:hypothetical protein